MNYTHLTINERAYVMGGFQAKAPHILKIFPVTLYKLIYIVGITFQPIKITGRHDTYCFEDMVTTTEVIDEICKNSRFRKDGFEPHPLNPHAVSVEYINRINGQCLTKEIFYGDADLSKLAQQRMYFTPDMSTEKYNYKELFRLTIVNFLDKFNFDFNLVKNSCIHFITEDLKVIPFDTYYMFHKPLTKII